MPLRPPEPSARAGQSLTEYVIALVLVAVALIAVVKNFGWRVEEKFFGSSAEVEFVDEDAGEGSR